jgi:neopullulanase
VVINKNKVETELDLARFAEVLKTPAAARDVLAGQAVTLGATVKLPPRSVKIFEVRRAL